MGMGVWRGNRKHGWSGKGLSGFVPAATALSVLLPAASAWADGAVKFTIIDAQTKTPLGGATIILDPDPTEIEPLRYNTESNGTVLVEELLAGKRKYTVILKSFNGIAYQNVSGFLTILDNKTVDITVQLDPLGDIEKKIEGKVVRLDLDDAGIYTFRDRKFFDFFPNSVVNKQDINRSLRSVAGVVPDSHGRINVRGEQVAPTTYIDGFQLPSFLAGRFAPLISSALIETTKVRTGGYSASQTPGSSVLEQRLRPAVRRGIPLAPYTEFTMATETYDGSSFTLNLGRQVGSKRPGKDGRPGSDSKVGYFISYHNRETFNAFESPQPNQQMKNNKGTSEVLTAKIDFLLTPKSEASFLLSGSVDHVGVANRNGLSNRYIGKGQGFGFGGNLNANALTVQLPNTQFVGASQQVLGNNVRQTDNNQLMLLQYKKIVSPNLDGVISFGSTESTQFFFNYKRAIPFNTIPADSSIEYRLDTRQVANQSQVQVDLNYKGKPKSALSKQIPHEYKFGFLTQALDDKESYRYNPQSQTANAALQNINGFIGNSLAFDTGKNTAPILLMGRTGTYSAFYIQDTWQVKDSMRVNYGFRVESYEQKQRMRFGSPTPTNDGIRSSRSENAASARVNLLYQLPNKKNSVGFGKFKLPLGFFGSQPTVLRIAYNQLFTPPGIGQGAIGTDQAGNSAIALPVSAQRGEQFDLSLERQLPGRQVVRIGTYSKTLNKALAIQQMINGTQNSAYSMVNQPRLDVNGFELTYELHPRSINQVLGALDEYQKGISAYFSYANSLAKRRGAQSGGLIPVFFAEQDQRDTFSAGIGYRTLGGSTVGLTYYYGSGLAGSRVDLGGGRSPISEVNFKIQSRPIRQTMRVEFGIENLTDSRGILSFDQGAVASRTNSFAGTRFQQGRRAVLSLTGKI